MSAPRNLPFVPLAPAVPVWVNGERDVVTGGEGSVRYLARHGRCDIDEHGVATTMRGQVLGRIELDLDRDQGLVHGLRMLHAHRRFEWRLPEGTTMRWMHGETTDEDRDAVEEQLRRTYGRKG